MVDRSDGVAVKAAVACVLGLTLFAVRLRDINGGEVETTRGLSFANKPTKMRNGTT